jgi:hypothetical protein
MEGITAENQENQNHFLYDSILRQTTQKGRKNLMENYKLIIEDLEKDLRQLDSATLVQIKNIEDQRKLMRIIDMSETPDLFFAARDKLKQLENDLYIQNNPDSWKINYNLTNQSKFSQKIEDIENNKILSFDGNLGQSILNNLSRLSANSAHTERSNLFVEPNNAFDQTKTILLSNESEIEFPIGMFIGAEGLKNWHGRGFDNLKDGKDSNEVINSYAQKPQESAPSVEDMTIYLYPNGDCFCYSGNAHRVAAAIQRGDKTIKFKGSATLKLMKQSQIETPNYYQQSLESGGRNSKETITKLQKLRKFFS